MRFWLWIVLLIVFNIWLGSFINVSFFFDIFVMIPLLIIVLSFLITLYNFKAFKRLLPIPARGNHRRLQQLNMDSSQIEKLKFRRIDAFYIPSVPDCIIHVFKHEAYPIFAYHHHFGIKRTIEFTTAFKNQISLSTCSDNSAGNFPRPETELLQVFDGLDVELLLDEHIKAVNFLQMNGVEPFDFPQKDFRKHFLDDINRQNKHIQSFSFWPVQMLFWILTKPGKKFAFPLEDQANSAIYHSESDRRHQIALKHLLDKTESSPKYNILFNGSILDGQDIETVKRNLSKLFNVDVGKIENLYQGDNKVIKKNVDQQLAKKYKNAFYKAGANCTVQKTTASRLIPLTNQENGHVKHSKIIKEEKIGCFAYALAFSSFIPLWGVPMGLISIILGWVKRKSGGWKIALIGGLGVLFTIVSYSGSLFLLDLFKKDGRLNKVTSETAQHNLTELVRSIEFYKLQHGDFPISLDQLEENSDDFIWIIDVTDTDFSGEEPRNYYYELDSSGSFYYLLSIGPDGQMATEDDIFPSISEDELGSLGYRRKQTSLF